jgi:hypothetical protein
MKRPVVALLVLFLMLVPVAAARADVAGDPIGVMCLSLPPLTGDPDPPVVEPLPDPEYGQFDGFGCPPPAAAALTNDVGDGTVKYVETGIKWDFVKVNGQNQVEIQAQVVNVQGDLQLAVLTYELVIIAGNTTDLKAVVAVVGGGQGKAMYTGTKKSTVVGGIPRGAMVRINLVGGAGTQLVGPRKDTPVNFEIATGPVGGGKTAP